MYETVDEMPTHHPEFDDYAVHFNMNNTQQAAGGTQPARQRSEFHISPQAWRLLTQDA